ncbi:MAG: hypothetical protein A2061_04425 [Gallionellales bacterium GWA2_59_43]|nr:MAG: hypothetical protein A2061_04425 [Gallionellales bacterium GWA2_59_43]
MRIDLPAVAREVKRIYFDTDVQMKSIAKVCTDNCPHCCHQNVRVHFGEGPIIEKFIREEMAAEVKARVKENLAEWLAYFDSVTPSGRILAEADILQFEKQITLDRMPCAFLVDGRCSIYKTRPLVCRTHSVNDSSSECNYDPHRNGDPKGIEIQRRKFEEISRASDMVGIRLLAYAVQEVLDLNHQCKPIGFNVAPTLRPCA